MTHRVGLGSQPALNQASQYRDAFAGMSAHDRHVMMMKDYMKFYGGQAAVQAAGGWQAHAAARAASQVVQSDRSALEEGHRFIRTAEDDAPGGGLAARLARKYYDRLFREYAIADLSRYKESKLGLRWRTQQEVVKGKGQFMCGAKGCEVREGLASFEVNFAYREAGEDKQALVKLRVCPECAVKLNYKKEKEFRRVQAKELEQAAQAQGQGQAGGTGRKRGAGGDGVGGQGHDRHAKASRRGEGFAEGEDKEWVVPPPGAAGRAAAAGGAGGAGTGASGAGGQQPSVLSADPGVWETKVVQEATVEEELDSYLEAMFM